MATYYARETHTAYGDSAAPSTVRSALNQSVCCVQGGSASLYRSFLRHDLSGIPYRSRITRAVLRVYDCWHNDNAQNGTINIARVTEDWSESYLCWNLMPQTTSRYLENNVQAPGVGNWSNWDITTLVQEWIDGQSPNYGLMIVNNNEGTYRSDWKFFNRAHTDGQFATYLQIEYEPETEVRITNARLTEIADQVRRITGTTAALTPSDIVTALENITV